MKNKREKKSYVVFAKYCRLFSVWKNAGMTMTCNRCDAMNIMWLKTEMEQECQSDNRTMRKQTDKQAQVKNCSKANKEQNKTNHKDE